jgi:ATP phosphoribosyltransferase regulatory subunit
MALKPDVTLSIIKNYKDGQQKVYYNENVYREGGSSHEFTEIMQVGLECIGDIDLYTQYEVLTLAGESLKRISPQCILDIASVDVISALMDATTGDEQAKRSLLEYVRGKNVHNIRALCKTNGIPEIVGRVWEELASMYGAVAELLPRLRSLCLNEKMARACTQLEELCRVLSEGDMGVEMNLDFSIVSDLNYYNGLVFKGYVQGIHSGVLSGGRYDNLVGKLGKKAGAIGFAVYLDMLKQLPDPESRYDADVLISYGADAAVETVMAKAREMREQGLTVRTLPAGEHRGSYRQTVTL